MADPAAIGSTVRAFRTRRSLVGGTLVFMAYHDEPTPTMQDVVARLQHALTSAGQQPLRPARDPDSWLARIAAEIAPLRLPAEVEEFWRLADGYSSSFTTFPHPHAADPESALRIWKDHQAHPGMTPNLLFPVCYESHAFLLVELDGAEATGGRRRFGRAQRVGASQRVGGAHRAGGACFTWAYDGPCSFELVAADLTSYLEVAAATLEEGHLERHERDGEVFHTFDNAAFRAALRDRLRSRPHPTYGNTFEVRDAPTYWPSHWLASVGPAALEHDALGATTTLADLAGSPPGVTGRVHARVDALWGFSGGIRVVIDDGTEPLRVWCPREATLFGPAYDGKLYEFELVTTEDGPQSTFAEAIAVRIVAQQPERESDAVLERD